MNINKWRNFLNEKKERLLREITEDEMEHIRDALDNMDSGEDLAFSELFGDRTRIVLDFKTADSESELGRFINLFDVLGYEVDWQKGLISATKTLQNTSPGGMSDRMLAMTHGGTGGKEDRQRKIQMKIGKFFAKIYDLATKQKKLVDQVFNSKEAASLKAQYSTTVTGEMDWWKNKQARHLTGNHIEAGLGEELAARHYQLYDQLNMYVGIDYGNAFVRDPSRAKNYMEYWQKNAGYIKKNIDKATSNEYSIVVTRHPVDILRMSDFNAIQSCHSPPSRGGGAHYEYYKCAVAEAHGHGAVAYVLNTEDLLHATNTSNIDSAEQEIQDGELFADDVRGSHVGASMDLTPISRLRLRQVRHYASDDVLNSQMGMGTQIAVPEMRIYGEKIPGFRQRIMKWARENQEQALANAPKRDGRIDLGRFIKFGGSQEDNQIATLLGDLYGHGRLPPAAQKQVFIGNIIKDTRTEDNLDVNLVGGILEQYEQACAEITDEWNNRMQACEVEARVEDDGGGSVYIALYASMIIKWDEDDFIGLPNYMDSQYAVGELNDIGYSWFEDKGIRSQVSYKRSQGEDFHKTYIMQKMDIEAEMIPEMAQQAYAYDPDGFEDFCVEVNKIDDMYDGIKEYLERYYKREGYMAGGQFMKLALNIEHGDLDPDFWEVELDDPYDPEEAYEAMAKVNLELDPGLYVMASGFPMTPEDMVNVLNSREFRTKFRTEVLKEPMKYVGTEMFLSLHDDTKASVGRQVSADGSGRTSKMSNAVDFDFVIKVTQDDPEILTKVFARTVEYMDDEGEFYDLANQTIKGIMRDQVRDRYADPKEEPQGLSESHKVMNSWRKFLNG